ncbi:MAG: SDR family oxidoreductase [Polyangiales bacterium]
MAYRGKVALVTGAGSGMGRLAARTFAESGAKVAALDVSEKGLAETAQGLPGIRTFKVDVTDAAAMQNAVEEIERELGPIDRVYNCAAIMPLGKLTEQDAAVQHKIMSINVGGLINVTRFALPKMVERRRGDFVSFASMAGIVPTVYTGAYSASKAAVLSYTEILYHENLNSGVRFVCVCPPAVDTPLLDQGRKTVWPKMLDEGGDLLKPIDVINAIEDGLEKGTFMVFPNRNAKIGAFVRRFFPNLIWKQVHQVEGF